LPARGYQLPLGAVILSREAQEKRIGEVGKWTLAAAFFFLPLNGLRQIAGVPIGDAFLALGIVLAVLLVVLRRRFPPIPRWLGLATVLFLGGFLVSAAFSPLDPAAIRELFPRGNDSAIAAFLKLLLSLAVLPVVVVALASRMAVIRLLATAWIAGVAVSCLLAVCDAYLGFRLEPFFAQDREAVEWWIGPTDPPRYPGFAAHPNSLGISAVLATPLLLASITDPRRLYVGFPVLLLFVWGVFLSGSRTAAVAFVLIVVAAFILIPRVRSVVFAPRLRQGAYQATLVLVFLLITFSGFGLELGSGGAGSGGAGSGGFAGPASLKRLGADDESANASDQERRELLETSFDLIAERPLTGSGFELIQSSHTVYLQPLVAGGVLALAGFVVAWLGFILTGVRLWRTAEEPARSFAIALTLSVGGYLIMGTFINGMLDRFLYLGPALVLALAVTLGKDRQSLAWTGRDQVESAPASRVRS